ncbi:TIGR00341 family protein [Candidatus Uhrbacteria bacterium CG10_big_fil_rev_8_21_14_0_10_50_16]|uniref:TIGR00341 family protein n=1 Tax=Candidatus Uhrbacteria bacterium CG10_big_fil_rev_8_21_14_0_10_50_16 TaxID=1975039 RepID=A0A2H0RLP3_9BACT|nr:MAG: TIGR00341 family protein [Candidatus Uhrbacteria bacterium CG10_big_fil_rev_8_21_14_0_10_50_16]
MLTLFSKLSTIEPTPEEKKDAVLRLIEDSSPTGGFYLMLLCATVIVAVGLMIGNASIVIGGMLVSPLLAPLLSLALGMAMGDKQVMLRSIWIVLLTSVFVFVVSWLMSLFMHFESVNIEIVSRIEPSLAYLVVALFAGIAGSFSYIKPNMNVILPGVAIAIAVLPPLAVSALGLSLGDTDILFGALSLFLVNMVGIVLASLMVFATFGFYPLRRRAEMEIKKEA